MSRETADPVLVGVLTGQTEFKRTVEVFVLVHWFSSHWISKSRTCSAEIS